MGTPNTVPLTYNGYVTQICVLAALQYTTVNEVVQINDSTGEAQTMLPQMINYAELRIQRDLDLFQAYVSIAGNSTTANINAINIDVDDLVTIRTIVYANGSSVVPLLPVSREFLQNVYNDVSYTAPPQYFAVQGADTDLTGNSTTSIAFGPIPDQAYPLGIRGTQRLPSLNQFNTSPNAGSSTTWISTYLPDLMLMASMIYLSGFQRNFGRQSDDPTMAVSYEQQYQALLKGASIEEARKKFQSSAWTSNPPTTVATKDR